MKTKRITALLLIALLLTNFMACSSDETETKPAHIETETDLVEVETEPEIEYEYPEYNHEGGEFRILNQVWEFGFYEAIDHESIRGEVLDDAIYNRNRNLEEQYNFKLVIGESHFDHIVTDIRKFVNASEDLYDTIVCSTTKIGPLVTEGSFYNMYDIDTLQLTGEWWNQSVLEEATLMGDSLFFLLGDLSLFTLESTWCLYFNESMMTDLNMEFPYDTVRENKWTFDILHTYLQGGTNLNGDADFTWNDNGNATYGLVSYYVFPHASIISAGELYIKQDESNTPYLALGSDRFYTLAGKIANICGTQGEYLSNAAGYTPIFMNGRALFMGGEIKATKELREMEDDFGIVPLPKLEESQEFYYSSIAKAAPLLSIPITNANAASDGILLDAMEFETYRDIVPIYYDISVSGKGLRNENSFEMLNIIRNTRIFDVGDAYGWTTTIQDKLRKSLDIGEMSAASIIASQKTQVEKLIQDTLAMIQKQ